MIVYNVDRSFFEKKADAEIYRRSRGLSKDRTIKIDIRDRSQLAALLNGLCALEPSQVNDSGNGTERPIEFGVPDTLVVSDADIPEFLRKDWAKHREGAAS